MKKLFLLISLIFSLYAEKIPITNSLELTIENKEFTILDFPFTIKNLTASKFIVTNNEAHKMKKESLLNDTKVPTVNINNPVVRKRKKKGVAPISNRKSYLNIKKGVNNLTITPKKEGTFELIVWGYKKFPIILHIKVSNNKHLDNYLKFFSPETEEDKASNFESNPHEKVIQALIKSMYNNHLINGYKMELGNMKPIISYGFKLKLNRSMVGNRYKVEEWYIRNLTNKVVKLYAQMFYQSGIYGVSFENDLLQPYKATRVFIVRKK